jgi:hypothetical protein
MFLRRIYRVLAVMIAVGSVLFSTWIVRASAAGDYRPDYSVFWTAANVALHKPSSLYDSGFMTSAQAWLSAPWHGPRPYAYPPSALAVFLPFSRLPFWPSFALWEALSILAFVATARLDARPRFLVLALLAPPTVVSLALGQTGLLIGAASMFSMSQLDRRPALAGLVLGMAAAIKPQALILAPIILSSSRNALVSFFGGGVVVLGVAPSWSATVA